MVGDGRAHPTKPTLPILRTKREGDHLRRAAVSLLREHEVDRASRRGGVERVVQDAHVAKVERAALCSVRARARLRLGLTAMRSGYPW